MELLCDCCRLIIIVGLVSIICLCAVPEPRGSAVVQAVWKERYDADIRTFRRTFFRGMRDGGLIPFILRFCWSLFFVYHCGFLYAIKGVGSSLLNNTSSYLDAREYVHKLWFALIDAYNIFWSAGMMIVYCNVFDAVVVNLRGTPTGCYQCFIVLVVGLIAAWRLYEIWAFLGMLHAEKSEYETFNKVRAITNVLWLYGQVALAFAVVHLCIAYLAYDTYRGNFANSPITPLYFSVATMVTIGYGDFSPQTGWGQAAVIVQSAFNIFLLVIIIQRAMTAKELPYRR